MNMLVFMVNVKNIDKYISFYQKRQINSNIGILFFFLNNYEFKLFK